MTKQGCIINPATGRAVKTTTPLGKKLMAQAQQLDDEYKGEKVIKTAAKRALAQKEAGDKNKAGGVLAAAAKRAIAKKPEPPKTKESPVGKDPSPPYPNGKYEKDFMEIQFMKTYGKYVSYDFKKLPKKDELEKYVKENGYKYTFSSKKKQFEAREGIFRDFNFASIEVYDDIVEFAYEGTDYYIFKSTDEPSYKPKFKDISNKLGIFADREVFDVYTLVDFNRNKIHWSVLIFDKSQAGQQLSKVTLKPFDKKILK